jgi:hypothetical protein
MVEGTRAGKRSYRDSCAFVSATLLVMTIAAMLAGAVFDAWKNHRTILFVTLLVLQGSSIATGLPAIRRSRTGLLAAACVATSVALTCATVLGLRSL